MSKLKKYVTKSDLSEVLSLYSKQSWLIDKEDSLIELILLCETFEHKKLVLQLLNDFHYLDSKTLSIFLSLIADYIVTDSGFTQDLCQIAAITYKDEADSGQKVLDYIKMPLFDQGWDDLKSVNHYGATIKNFKAGRKQIIFIDEFIGSGKTVLTTIKQLENDIKDKFELKFCFIAGMDYGIKKIEALGYEVFCPLRLPMGISEKYQGSEMELSKKIMISLESKLSLKINNYELSNYSFGYNGAEALYSLAGCHGNTPNSVFPIFWWPRLFSNKPRKTLLTRFERGLK